MKSVFVLILLSLFHTWPYWNINENLAGTPGDPFAHAAIGEWYCKNVVTMDFHFDGFMAPEGVNVAGNYDSPFPFILTCPFVSLGPHVQFHLFSFMQILLILFSAWAAARVLLRNESLRWAYVFLTWFCSFYVVRSHVHLTLLSVIWGFQLSLFAIFRYNPNDRKNVILSFFLLSLSLCGTFQNLTALFLIDLLFLGYVLKNTKYYSSHQRINLYLGLGTAAVVFLFLWGPMLFFTLTNQNPVFSGADLRDQNFLTIRGLLFPYGSNYMSSILGVSSGRYEQTNSLDWIVFLFFIVLLCLKRFKLSLVDKLALAIGIFYLYISFGPSLPGSDWIFSVYPFKIGRTPARFAVVTHLLMIVLTLRWIQDYRWSDSFKKKLGIGLSLWAVLWGPAANGMWFAPTFKYRSFLPEKGLAEIKNNSNEKTTVVMIPSAWAQEPAYNFLRLFHKRNISSAYLAYPVYNEEILRKVSEDPFLSEIDCGTNLISFKNGAIMNDQERLRNYVKEKGFDFIVINKRYLTSAQGCEPLKNWILKFLKYPWVKVIEENSTFLVVRNQ